MLQASIGELVLQPVGGVGYNIIAVISLTKREGVVIKM